jgi:hypothetical protein
MTMTTLALTFLHANIHPPVLYVVLLFPSVLGGSNIRPVRLAYQPPASSTFLSERTSHQQPASGTFLSEQTSTSHQPPAKRKHQASESGVAAVEQREVVLLE